MRSCTLEVFREVNRRKQICFHIVINHLKRKRQKKQLKTLFQFSYERVISLLTVKRLEISFGPHNLTNWRRREANGRGTGLHD